MTTESAAAYERHARDFLRRRDHSTIGVRVVDRWARSLEAGTEVIDVGCGGGLPVTRTLADVGLEIWGIDASPTLCAEFQDRFPAIPLQCSCALESDYFRRRFGAAISIGLVFLLDEGDQLSFIRRLSEILVPGGRLLFTAPTQTGTWTDVCTGHECLSLGRETYLRALAESGISVIASYDDEGRNNYYEAERVDLDAEAR